MLSTSSMYGASNIGSGNSRNSPPPIGLQQQHKQPQNTPLKQHNSVSSSLTTSSASSSTSDFGDLHGDLLADLWHSSTNESMTSNGAINVKQPAAQYPSAIVPSVSQQPQQQQFFPQQQQQQPRLFNPNPVYTTQQVNWNTSNVSISPPILSSISQQQISTVAQPNSSSSPSLTVDPFIDSLHGYESSLLPRLTEENLMMQTKSDSFTTTHNPNVQFNIANDSEDLFNFEHHQQQQQQSRFVRSTPMLNGNVRQQPFVGHSHNSQHKESSDVHAHMKTNVSSATVNTQLYKTELCASFMKMGICPYGNKCQFAHGENELKVVERPPKWRSKPCVNWAKYGSCRYGNRCCFKHGD
ncbi:uncharacterized protein SPAPADRAFT_60049 [Spathaspora passalidarum NRRL Y-27907]|uniref:C3H1-type domain-containing protein n=1 Tax=Spathaspora passalidarum (strain NRRL Y-27907 / 11-Y1) TaxID=619300 RepID=G3ALT2_SPAPN|nr:uncharacterized protein SPAPADRAFT_60049 [Spathaspora passalidarum NRRL Y-27907]EGW32691.1 hypothetical protein SPAPADRAFT_60049 [Spathaspora passalidarum NRRL Y-27907]